MSHHNHDPRLVKLKDNGMPDNSVPPQCPVDVLLRGAMMIDKMVNPALNGQGIMIAEFTMHDLVLLKLFTTELFDMIKTTNTEHRAEQLEKADACADGETKIASNVVSILDRIKNGDAPKG